MLREVKPKNARSARALAKRAPLNVENSKKTLFLRSTSSSSLLKALTSDLFVLKRPLAARFNKKNPLHPFEDPSSLEFFSLKNDTSLLCFTSHSKKRPHCFTFVRCFEARVLDMLECTVDPDTARTLSQFSGPKSRVGIKPLLSFSGSAFEDPESSYGTGNKFVLAKSMFLDFFRGDEATEVDVEGLQTMITFTAVEQEIDDGNTKQMVYMRVWRIVTKRSGQKLPRVEIEETGPRIDFRLDRIREADDALWKQALRKGRGTEARSKKNVETDTVGDRIGRIHLGKQDLSNLQTRKLKGLKRSRDEIQEEMEGTNGMSKSEDDISDEDEDEDMLSEGSIEGGEVVDDDSEGDAKRLKLS